MDQGGDDGRGKRKTLTKQLARRCSGRTSGGSGASSRATNRATHDQDVDAEEMNQRIGYTIPVLPGTPNHLMEFDDSYMRDNEEEFVLREPHHNVTHSVVDYGRSWKATSEAREIDPYAIDKLLGVDYWFWNVFHSNFYGTTIMTKPRGKICKMQYIDFNGIQDRNEFAAAIKTYDIFQLTDMARIEKSLHSFMLHIIGTRMQMRFTG